MAKDAPIHRPNGGDHGKYVSDFYINTAANDLLKALLIDLFITFPLGPILASKRSGFLCPRFDCEKCLEGQWIMRHSLTKVGKVLAGFAAAAAMAAALSLPAKASSLPVSFASDVDLGTLTSSTKPLINDLLITTPATLTVKDITNSKTATGAGHTFSLAYDFTLGSSTTGIKSLITQTGSISNFKVTLLSLAGQESKTIGLGTQVLANLAPGNYELVFSGTANAVSGFTASISAVPLPGALLLFGSSLLGLGAVRRIRQRGLRLIGGKAVAVMLGLLGLAALPFFGASSAEAATVETINLGTVNLQAGDAVFFLYADSSPYSSLTYPSHGDYVTVEGTTSGSGTTYNYVYTFSVSSPAQFSVNLNPSSPLSAGLIGGAYSTSTSSDGVLSLLASLTTGHTYSLTLSQGAGYVLGAGTISAVPIPGALVLFGSGLVGLATFARRKAKRAA